MTVSKQVETSIESHAGGHTCHNALPTSPVSKSSRSYATKNQTPVRLASSKSANLSNEASLPLIQHLKVPVGDGPYVRAKQVQLVEKDPERAIAFFWAAINVGDRVDSALKDMAVVMKQQNRGDEAIQAILSFRHLCSPLAQESLDNVLLDLYKKCGRLDDQIELLKHKLNLIHQGMVFNGKRTKTARSQGRKFQISIREEATRLLGNLGWSYMQLCNYVAAEAIYRKALSIDADSNKLCNLGLCLLKQHKFEEARVVLEGVTPMTSDGRLNSESHMKSFERSRALLQELHTAQNTSHIHKELASEDTINKNEQRLITPKYFDLWTHWKLWEPPVPNFSPDTGQISDTPAEISTNPALQHFKISNTNDPLTMQKSYNKSKEIVGAAHITDDLHHEMPNSICNYADDMVTAGTISHTTQRHAGSFKREIGPLSTVQPSKAKKNTHGNDKINGGICNFAVENYINTDVDACGLSNGWDVSPAMTCQKPVARRLLLGYKGVQSDKESITCVSAIANVTDELMNASSCSREGSNVIDEDFQLHSCTMDTKFNDKARDDAADAAILDFTCVDRVIESIVPDTSSASQDIFNTNGMGNSNAHALKNARYHQDQIFAPSEGAHAQHVESLDSLNGVHQYRLRIFQERPQAVP